VILFQNWPLRFPERYQHQLSRRWLRFEHFFFWLARSDVSISYSGVCFLERNGGSPSRL
jgi:hypothetical protein